MAKRNDRKLVCFAVGVVLFGTVLLLSCSILRENGELSPELSVNGTVDKLFSSEDFELLKKKGEAVREYIEKILDNFS